jgi:DUF4097 and DUF4098 domain-containing protein YvlB
MRLGIIFIIVGASIFLASMPRGFWLARDERSVTSTGKIENGVLISGHKNVKTNYELLEINTLVLETFSGTIEVEMSKTMSSIGEFEIIQSSGDNPNGQQNLPRVERNDKTLILRAENSDCQNCLVSYKVKLGKAMRLELRNQNGDITVNGLCNSIKASSTNGEIKLSNTGKTRLDLISSNGGVILENLDFTANSQSRVQSINGDISISQLGGNSGLVIFGHTENGSLNNQRQDLNLTNQENGDFQMTLNGSNPAKLELLSSNGDITLE